jgi:hypothetical protein
MLLTMRKLLLFVLLLGSASASGAGAFETARLSMDSLGPVRVGMTIEEARAAAGVEMVLDGTSDGGCALLRVVKDRGIQFMVEKGRLTRIDITDAHHPTLSGILIGDTEEHARQVYGGRLEVTRHKYDQDGHYLTLRSRDRRQALVLETDGKHIARMRAGLVPSVEYVEGCL